MNKFLSLFTWRSGKAVQGSGHVDYEKQTLALTRRGQAIQILGILAAVGSLIFVRLQFNTQIRVAQNQLGGAHDV
jgi:hypothetical protein